MASVGRKLCKRPGCSQYYTDEQNHSDACLHHSSPPVFHDGVKKWVCCDKESWDWDEFTKIPGCTKGYHSDEKMEMSEKQIQKKPVEKTTPKQNMMSINDFNKSIEIKSIKPTEVTHVQQNPFVTPSGKHKCINKGCNQEYTEKDNSDTSCRYHSGQPLFRDTNKSWTCCNASSYDWDDFMGLPTCCIGKHVPKMVNENLSR